MTDDTKIKICGLKRQEDIAIANRLCPDYVGFVFAGTKRNITKETAAALRAALSPGISSVGVFVNEPAGNIGAMCREGILDLVQLHGDETEDEIAAVKALTGKPVIRAVRVRTVEDIIAKADTCADYLLFDTYRAGEYGGGGECFCWEELLLAEKFFQEKGRTFPPFFLAGGLTIENAGEAVKSLRPYALDVSSGIETDGFKDGEKVAGFIAAVRGDHGE